MRIPNGFGILFFLYLFIFQGSIFTANAQGSTVIHGKVIAEGTGEIGYMMIEAEKSVVGYTTPAGKRSYAFIKKYRHPHSLQKNTDDNFPIYRYSEALNEQDKSSEALDYVNQIRRRAGLSDLIETDKSRLRNIIAHERRVELAFENRWFDLVGTDKAIEVMNAHGASLKSKFSHLLPKSYEVTKEKLIYAIPFRETVIGGLDQNPGY